MEQDLTMLYELLAGLPDQLFAVLLAHLTIKTFVDMIK